MKLTKDKFNTIKQALLKGKADGWVRYIYNVGSRTIGLIKKAKSFEDMDLKCL